MQANNLLCTPKLSSLYRAYTKHSKWRSHSPEPPRALDVNCLLCPMLGCSVFTALRTKSLQTVLKARKDVQSHAQVGFQQHQQHHTEQKHAPHPLQKHVCSLRCSHTGEPCRAAGILPQNQKTEQETTSTTRSLK